MIYKFFQKFVMFKFSIPFHIFILKLFFRTLVLAFFIAVSMTCFWHSYIIPFRAILISTSTSRRKIAEYLKKSKIPSKNQVMLFLNCKKKFFVHFPQRYVWYEFIHRNSLLYHRMAVFIFRVWYSSDPSKQRICFYSSKCSPCLCYFFIIGNWDF